jgi:nicotinamide mononucleotide (NMN) deamidase PncC
VAGPDDQGDIKAGTVYIGVAHPGGTSVEKYQFPSRRPLVRGRAVTAALLQLTKALQGD